MLNKSSVTLVATFATLHWSALFVEAKDLNQDLIDLMSHMPCGETSLNEIGSPDGKYVASLRIRNCGATTREATHLYLHEKSGPAKDDDLVFVGEFIGNSTIQWVGNDRLVVSGKCRRIFKQEKMKFGTKIEIPECDAG